jgi:hypothetical protein
MHLSPFVPLEKELVMNDIDRENLRFILDNNGIALEVWYNSLSQEQRNYASRLLDVYKEELALKNILIRDPYIASLKESTQVLAKFR